MGNVFIGMETSGVLRRRFAAAGHWAISCDTLPAEDGAGLGLHIVGDVFDTIESLRRMAWVPDLAIFHPTCTFHAVSAAWAFSDPDFEKYPGVGYHQRVQPGTLVGSARRDARAAAEVDVERIKRLPIRRKAMENPKGTIPTRTSLGRPQQIIQPYECGDDASKATCLWYFDEEGNPPPDLHIVLDPAQRVRGRLVEWNGKVVERWANQTDSGQNNVTPGADRWKDRSRTYPGVADTLVRNWLPLLPASLAQVA